MNCDNDSQHSYLKSSKTTARETRALQLEANSSLNLTNFACLLFGPVFSQILVFNINKGRGQISLMFLFLLLFLLLSCFETSLFQLATSLCA